MNNEIRWLKIRDYVYETGKEEPVAIILENGQCLDLTPMDIEDMKKISIQNNKEEL